MTSRQRLETGLLKGSSLRRAQVQRPSTYPKAIVAVEPPLSWARDTDDDADAGHIITHGLCHHGVRYRSTARLYAPIARSLDRYCRVAIC